MKNNDIEKYELKKAGKKPGKKTGCFTYLLIFTIVWQLFIGILAVPVILWIVFIIGGVFNAIEKKAWEKGLPNKISIFFGRKKNMWGTPYKDNKRDKNQSEKTKP